jgi:hypothetical protein
VTGSLSSIHPLLDDGLVGRSSCARACQVPMFVPHYLSQTGSELFRAIRLSAEMQDRAKQKRLAEEQSA